MLLSRSATIVGLAAITLFSSQIPSAAVAQERDTAKSGQGTITSDAAPEDCPVTMPSRRSFVSPSAAPPGAPVDFGVSPDGIDGTVSKYGTEKLWTVVPTDGVWRGSPPRQPGDFAYANKLPWFRQPFSGNDGLLTITGKRLDGPAPYFTETLPSSYFPHTPMMMGGIEIPVFGCWQITGQLKDQDLSFVVWVTAISSRESPSDETSPTISQAPPATRRIHLNGEVQAKSLVYRVTPEIPREAQEANVSGTVVLHAIITRNGRPSELQYVSGPPLLAKAAIDAVTWWQYRVATSEDNPDEAVEVDTTIDVVFPPTG